MTEDEFRTGKRADGSPIGFAASRAVGHVMAGENPFDYIAEAFVTLSPSWHGDKVSRAHFMGRINGAIDAANKLDQVKKTLFYGRDNNLVAEGERSIGVINEHVGNGGNHGANIIHAIIGVFTEAGELLEALRDDYNSDNYDPINLKEEVGDLFWYVAILARECGFTFDEAQRVNIAKLRGRFPERFTEYDANNRNLSDERAILEGKPIVGNGDELSEDAKERLSK